MTYFQEIIKHYIVLALRAAGVEITSDMHAELDEAFESLERGIQAIIREDRR